MKRSSLFIPLLFTSFLPLQAEQELTQELADRYEQILLRSPAAGSAFDHVISWYSTQGGGLERLQARWAAGQGATYLILQGLLAERRYDLVKARESYQRAMKEGADAAPAARLLGALETTEGNFPAAVAAYESALESKALSAIDQLDLLRSLAMLHQRAFAIDEAMKVWERALQQHPDDLYLLEEAGDAFLSARRFDDAHKAFTTLREKSERDPFRRIGASLRLARTEEERQQPEKAVEIYEQALADASEGSWLAREIRSRIEDLYRRKNDLPGLLAYYERRTAGMPRDHYAFAAMAQVLMNLQRLDEGVAALRKATELAPGDVRLRLSLIEQLREQRKLEEAISEAEVLAKSEDASIEVLQIFGDLQWDLALASNDEALKKTALATWGRIAPESTRDVARIARLADKLYIKDLVPEAIVQWERLIALEPDALDARTRLAEAFLKQEDTTRAQAVLAAFIDPKGTPSPEQFLALARVQSRLEWHNLARATGKEGLKRHPESYDLLSFVWQQALDADDTDEALARVLEVYDKAPNDYFAEDVANRYLMFLARQEPKKETIEQWRKVLQSDLNRPLDALLLFRIAVSLQNEVVAKEALDAFAGKASAVRGALAKSAFADAFGTMEEKIAALETIVDVDPRRATDSQLAIVHILSAAGKVDEALGRMDLLLTRSPGDARMHSSAIQIASQAGRQADVIVRLKNAIRLVEENHRFRMELAMVYIQAGDQREALPLLEEAFEKAPNPQARMEVFRQQAQLMQRRGRLDELIHQLKEKQARERGGAHYGAYLAEIYLLEHDYLSAKEELSRSLGHNPSDVSALNRLKELALRGNDMEEAIRLSMRLVEVEPTTANKVAHLGLLQQSPERALAFLNEMHGDVLAHPQAWADAVVSLRHPLLAPTKLALMEEVARRDQSLVGKLGLARFHLTSGRYDEGEALLWSIVEANDLRDAVKTLEENSAHLPARSYGGYPVKADFRYLMQGLHNIANQEIARWFSGHGHTMWFSSHRVGNFSMMSSSMQVGALDQLFTSDPALALQAWFCLARLSRELSTEADFEERSRVVLKAWKLSRGNRMLLAEMLGLPKVSAEWQALIAAEPDLKDDSLLAPFFLDRSAQSEDAKQIIKRHREENAAFDFRCALVELHRQQGADGFKGQELEALRKLLAHPGMAALPEYDTSLVGLIARYGDEEMVLNTLEEYQKKANTHLSLHSNRHSSFPLVARLIALNAKSAKEQVERYVEGQGASASNQILQVAIEFLSSVEGNIEGRKELVRWMNENYRNSPESIFQILSLAVRLQDDDLPELRIFSHTHEPREESAIGKEPLKALRDLEQRAAARPDGQEAALLIQIYEVLHWHVKQAPYLESAPLMQGESQHLRLVRKVRALRLSGKQEEAKKLAQTLSAGRLSLDAQGLLQQEAHHLGITYVGVRRHGFHYSTRHSHDRGQQVREKVDQLTSQKKMEELEQLIRRIILAPFPRADQHQERSVRHYVISRLQNFAFANSVYEDLSRRMKAAPADTHAAITLYECLNDRERQEKLRQVILEKFREQDSPSDEFAYFLNSLSSSVNRSSHWPEMVVFLFKEKPEWLARDQQLLNDVISRLNGNEKAYQMAAALSEVEPAVIRQMLLPFRLSGNTQYVTGFTALAHDAASRGQSEVAIRILTQVFPDLVRDRYNQSFSLALLAELQLAKGDKEDARDTLREAFGKSKAEDGAGMSRGYTSVRYHRGFSGQEIPYESLVKLAKVLKETGMLAEFSSFKEDFGESVLFNALVLAYAEEAISILTWTELLNVIEKSAGLQRWPIALSLLQHVAKHKQAAELTGMLVEKLLVEQSSQTLHLEMLTQSFNGLAPFLLAQRKEPRVAKYIKEQMESIRSQVSSVPIERLRYNGDIPAILQQFLDSGEVEIVQSIYEVVAPRLAGGDQISDQWKNAFKRLIQLEQKALFSVNHLPQVMGENKARVYWSFGPESTDQERQPFWSPSPLSARETPVKMEILVGTRLAKLQPAATIAKPASSGKAEVALPGPFSLVQTRWQMKDGAVHYSAVVPVVQGQEIFTPSEKLSSHVVKGLPGVAGEPTALGLDRFKTSFQRGRVELEIGTIKRTQKNALLILSGWVRQPKGSGYISIDWGNGRREDIISLRSSENDERWQYVHSVLFSRSNLLFSGRSIPEDVNEGKLMLLADGHYLNQGRVYDVQWDQFSVKQVEVDSLSTAIFDVEGSVVLTPEKTRQEVRRVRTEKNDPVALPGLIEKMWHSSDFFASEGEVISLLQQSKGKEGGDIPLLKALSSPVLFQRHPLHSYSMPVELNSSLREAIRYLIKEALLPDASPALVQWLKQVEKYSLPEELRNELVAQRFLARCRTSPEEVTPDEVLETLGFTAKSSSESSLMNLLNRPENAAAILDSLLALKVTDELLAKLAAIPEAQRSHRALAWKISAILQSRNAPDVARNEWARAMQAPYRHYYNFETFDKRFLLLQVAAEVDPEVLIESIRHWTSSDPGEPMDVRSFSRLLEIPTTVSGKHQEIYRREWAKQVVQMLAQLPPNNVSHETFQMAASYLLEGKDFDNFQELLNRYRANSPNAYSSYKKEMESYDVLLGLLKGDTEKAMLNLWALVPGEGSDETTLVFQWGPMLLKQEGDLTVGRLPAPLLQPLLDEMPGQVGVEILFGESLNEMARVQYIDGKAAHGKVSVKLPQAVGFLRAVATVNGKAIESPTLLHAVGKRVFPVEGTLRDAFAAGVRSIDASMISSDGTTPDGQPSYTFSAERGDSYQYKSPLIPIVKNRAYLVRGWMAPGRLELPRIELRDNRERHINQFYFNSSVAAPTQWRYYYQLIYAPLDDKRYEGANLQVQWSNFYRSVPIGTLEIIELPDTKLAQGILKMEQYLKRSNRRAPLDEEALEELIEIVRRDPVYAFQWHRSEIVGVLKRQERYSELAEFLQAILSVDGSPLSANISHDLLASIVISSVREDFPEKQRLDLLQSVLQADRLDPASSSNWSSMVLSLMKHTPADELEAMRDRLVERFLKSLDALEEGRFYDRLFSYSSDSDGNATNHLIEAVRALDRPKLTQAAIRHLKQVPPSRTERRSPTEAFDLIFEMIADPSLCEGEEWPRRLDRVFGAFSKTNQTDAAGLVLLTGALLKSEASPSALAEFSRRGLDYLKTPGVSVRDSNVLMALSRMNVEAQIALAKPDMISKAVGELVELMKANRDLTASHRHSSLLAIMDQLNSATMVDESLQIYQVIRPAVQKRSGDKAAYAPYEELAAKASGSEAIEKAEWRAPEL